MRRRRRTTACSGAHPPHGARRFGSGGIAHPPPRRIFRLLTGTTWCGPSSGQTRPSCASGRISPELSPLAAPRAPGRRIGDGASAWLTTFRYVNNGLFLALFIGVWALPLCGASCEMYFARGIRGCLHVWHPATPYSAPPARGRLPPIATRYGQRLRVFLNLCRDLRGSLGWATTSRKPPCLPGAARAVARQGLTLVGPEGRRLPHVRSALLACPVRAEAAAIPQTRLLTRAPLSWNQPSLPPSVPPHT